MEIFSIDQSTAPMIFGKFFYYVSKQNLKDLLLMIFLID